MQDFLNKILSGVEKTTKTVVQKSGDVAKITKIRMSISGDTAKIQEIIFDIGEAVYEAFESGNINNTLVEEKCEQIQALKLVIEEKRDELARLRNLQRCCACDHENEADAIYCNRCGAKLPELAEEVAFEEEASEAEEVQYVQVQEDEPEEDQ